MAVVAVWKCDRDGSLFDTKKEAEVYDKSFELAETITLFLNQEITGIDEQISKEIGLALAKRRDDLLKACKGKMEALLPKDETPEVEVEEEAKALDEDAGANSDESVDSNEDDEENVVIKNSVCFVSQSKKMVAVEAT